MFRSLSTRGCWPVVAWVLSWWAATAAAATTKPTIHELSLRGLSSGTTTRLVIVGENLLTEPRLLMSVPIASQKVLEGAAPNRVEVELTMAADITPGIYQLWLATSQGISAPVAVAVDALPNSPISNSIATLPVALSGKLEGNAVARTTFEGKAGDPIVIDAECSRLASSLKPVLHLYDSRNVQIAWGQSSKGVFGDARISIKLPADGRYTVELHDALFRAEKPGYYRLKLGRLHFADMPFPLGARSGRKAVLNFANTNFPPNTSVTISPTGEGEVPVPWPGLDGLSGVPPKVIVSSLNEVVEAAPKKGLQKLTAPVAINGRIARNGEEDRYQLAVKPGVKLHLDVLAQRAGSPLDSVLKLLAADGKELASNDDRMGNADPMLDFTVPDNVKSVIVSITDVTAAGGDNYVYRIAVEQSTEPDFSLAVVGSDVELSSEGVAIVRVHADRKGYQGPIRLSLDGAPTGVKIGGGEIPAGATDAMIGLEVGDHEPEVLLTKIVGEGVDLKRPLRHPALVKARQASVYQPWLRSELALALTAPGALRVNWEAASADPQLMLGGELPIKVQVSRAAGREGNVRISLLTTQNVPTKRVDKNPAFSNKSSDMRFAPDNNRALRLKENLLITSDQSSAAATVLVPGDLAEMPYDISLQADLLGPDGKEVLATAFAPVQRLKVDFPFTVSVVDNKPIDARAGLGESGKITGKIDRLGGFAHPVTVALTGLPTGFAVPMVELDDKATEFVLPVSFPFNTPQGALKDAKLTAFSPINPAVPVKVNQVPVDITVVAGNPPPKLYRVFEDEPAFAMYLTDGNGEVTLEEKDAYSGKAALKVATPYRGRKMLPGLGIKIREKPGDGEYRYMRFAWKANGGRNVMVQFKVNGGKSPARGENLPPYAYESGDGANPIRGSATRVDSKIPKGWVVVTRDLFSDFGEFTLDGLTLYPDNDEGSELWFDHFYLAKGEKDLAGCPPPRKEKSQPK